jgi:hypothetical protein
MIIASIKLSPPAIGPMPTLFPSCRKASSLPLKVAYGRQGLGPHFRQQQTLFDHLIGESEQRGRDSDAEGSRMSAASRRTARWTCCRRRRNRTARPPRPSLAPTTERAKNERSKYAVHYMFDIAFVNRASCWYPRLRYQGRSRHSTDGGGRALTPLRPVRKPSVEIAVRGGGCAGAIGDGNLVLCILLNGRAGALRVDVPAMKDMQAHLKKLRAQIAECERLQRAAKGRIKRDVFRRLVAHYRVLASDLEQAIVASRTEEE